MDNRGRNATFCLQHSTIYVRSGFSSSHLTHISLVSFLLSLHFYLGQWSLSKCASDKNLWIQESKASACRFHVSRQFITKHSNSCVVDCWNHNGRTPLNLSSMYQLLVGTTTIKQSSMASAAHFPSLLHLFVNRRRSGAAASRQFIIFCEILTIPVRHKLNRWWILLLCKLGITNPWHVKVILLGVLSFVCGWTNTSGILSASPRCFTGQVSVEFATSPTTMSGIHTMFPSGQHHKV